MRTTILCAFASLLVALAAPVSVAAEAATVSVPLRAEVASRTSLKVSTEVLEFAADQPGEEAIAVVNFSAGARTHRGGEVVLTVESIRGPDGPGGAADAETAVTFSGEGQGTANGALLRSAPSVAGRWNGSGLRTGRLTFALRASATGAYSLPLRFVLSTP